MVLLGFLRGRSSLGDWTEPPFSDDEKLLVGVFRVQVVAPLFWALRSGTQPPPAAGRAPRLHSAICGFARRQPPRPESPSRRAGRTMEIGAGPVGAARPRRGRTDRRAAAAPRLPEVRRTHPLEGEVAGLRSGSAASIKAAAPGAVPSAPLAASLPPPP